MALRSGCEDISSMRGEIVPCLWLREVFAIEGQPPAIEPVVVVTVEGTRIGIAVDRVVGEYQTVIKNLGPLYRDVEEFSGATIRGDGTMSQPREEEQTGMGVDVAEDVREPRRYKVLLHNDDYTTMRRFRSGRPRAAPHRESRPWWFPRPLRGRLRV